MTANAPPGGDMQVLAKGGRTNVIGFVLRLAARLPFLLIATKLYGPEALGRFASALVVVELAAMLCTMGEKRGLAQRLSEGNGRDANLVFDGLLVAVIFSAAAAGCLWLLPGLLFPNGMSSPYDVLIVLAIPGYALTEIMLAAQAYRYDVATTVRARAIVEPWAISIFAGIFWFVPVLQNAGLPLAYLLSIYAGTLTAAWTFLKRYGLPSGWRPYPSRLLPMIARASPLTLADAIEWGTRRVDIFILGLFAAPAAVGIYYTAQQLASLPQKLKTSFEPILGPVIARNLREKDYAAIARQVCQVGFWIIAAQAGIALALGIPGEAMMGLFGEEYIGGTGALAFLLAAEVVAATAVVAEAALIYVARLRNLWVSIGTIALQVLLTLLAMELIEHWQPADPSRIDLYRAAAAAGALMLALGAASVIKAVMLTRILREPINNWRWPLVWASAAAVAVGQVAILLPKWAELAFGIPAILGVYAWVIWTRGFGPEDRVLFSRKLAKAAAEDDPPKA